MQLIVIAVFVVAQAPAMAAPTVVVDFVDGVVLDTSGPLTGSGTTADQMAGIQVAVVFDDGTEQVLNWIAISPGEGGVADADWSLHAFGDTYDGVWTLEATGSKPIRSVDVNGPPAAVLFDTTFGALFGTPGSGAGRTFEAISGPSELDIHATYCDVVGVEGEPPVGDLFGRLTLLFTNPEGLAPGSTLEFRADTDALTAGSEVFPATNYVWDNGDEDRRIAYLSTVNAHVDSVVADDCWLPEGAWYHTAEVSVRMAVTDGFEPDTELRVYEDCDGRPDDATPYTTLAQTDAVLIDDNPGGDLTGARVWEIFYHHDELLEGGQIHWFAPVHRGSGIGYWLSANAGVVQGRQPQMRAPALGMPDWSDVGDTSCCGICTDMFLRIEGKCCWRVLAQSDYALDGLTTPMLAQHGSGIRSFEDAQIAEPCVDDADIQFCRVEAYFATNCDPTTIAIGIHDNDCDTPADPLSPVYTLTPTSVIPTGEVVQVGGLAVPVLHVVADCPEGISLTPGNYWFSVYSLEGNVAGKYSLWLFSQRDPCDVRINEARYYNPAIGIVEPTPVSDPGLAGVPRGLAISVWIAQSTH